MEDEAGNPFRSSRSWMKSALTYSGFSFKSLLTRQILSAVSGLLVNLLITPLVVRFVDVDFQSSSMKKALLVSLVSMVLAFIFRYYLVKLKSHNWYTFSDTDTGTDTGGYSDGINLTGQQNSDDALVFTCFRFPVPEYLQLDTTERLLLAEDTTQDDNRESAPVFVCSEPVRLSSSLSETPPQPPPPPSYQPQWITSKPSSSHHRLLPSAPPSPMKGKGKLRASRKRSQLENMSPKASLLHQSLLHPMHTFRTSKPFEPRFCKQEASSLVPRRKVNRYTAGQASASSPQQRSWAWEFMEKTSFDKFKREYANFRSISSSSLGAFSTNTVRNEASRRNVGQAESDANESKNAQAPLGIENDHQLQKPAQLQLVTLDVNVGVRKKDKKGMKCGVCLKTFLPSFCFQRRKQRWNSRRYRQIAHAPLLWSPSTINPPTNTLNNSPAMGCCI